MSQSEALRMVAEVQDRFTGPLGALKKQMENLSREGGVHTDTLTKGFGRLTSEAQAAEKAISSGLKPALGVVGITGLSAAAAITGIASAMRSFAAGAASLGALSRETGQTAENLRNFGAVAGKFGIEQDAVAAGTKNFAGQMREFGRGIGETFQWLNRQGRDAAGRRHFQDFAADLRATTDSGEQLRKVLREMENIKDPVERGMFAEKFFGNTDFGRLGDKHFGPILEMWKKTAQKLGPLDPAAVKSAEDFERTMSELRTSMQKLGTTIGQEVLPYASQFTTWLSDIVGGQRNDAIKAIRQGIGEIRREIDGIDWKGAGERAKEFLTGTITFAGDLVKALKAAGLLLGALKDLKDGNVSEALKKLGAADSATDLGMGQGRAPGAIQDSMRADTGPLVLRRTELERQRQVLEENIARRESQPNPMGEGRVVDTEGRARRDRLIDETRKLSDEIRRLREDPPKRPAGEATAQPSAFESGTGMGGLIHRASLGGMAGAAAAGRYLGGGNGIVVPGVPGYGGGAGGRATGGGEAAPDSGPRAAGRALRPEGRDRLFGGDPGGQGGESRAPRGGGPDLDSGPRAVGRVLRPSGGDRLFGRDPTSAGGTSGAAAAGQAMRRGGRPFSGKLDLRDADPNVVAYIREAAKARGIDPDTALAVSDGEGLRNFGPNKPVVGDGGTSHGPFQMHYAGGTGANRQPGLGDAFTKATGLDARDPSTWKRQVDFSLDHAAKNGWGAWYGRQHHGVGRWDGIGGRAGYAGGQQSGEDVAGKDGSGAVDQRQGGGIRRQPITDELREQLARAGRDAGVNAEVYSGGQDESGPNRTGSHRHDHGRSADVKLYRTDEAGRRRYLKMSDDADRTAMEGFIRGTVRYGANGVGSGPGYMGESGIHIGGGSPLAWGAGGRAANAPEWVRRAHREGMEDRASGLGRRRPQESPSPGFEPGAFSADFKRRQAEEDERRKGLAIAPSARDAIRAGVGGNSGGEAASGRLDLHVHDPGPNTRVVPKAVGSIFREIRQMRGRQMQPAGEDT